MLNKKLFNILSRRKMIFPKKERGKRKVGKQQVQEKWMSERDNEGNV